MEKNEQIREREERLRKLAEIKKINLNPYPAKTGRNFTVAKVLEQFKNLEELNY